MLCHQLESQHQVSVTLNMFDQIKDFINPSKNPDLTQAHEYQRKHLPT
ncbi:kinase, partial [Vibrio breoganii]